MAHNVSTTAPPNAQRIIDEIAPFVLAGFAVHWLKPRSKAPIESGWSDRPVNTLAALQASCRPDYNVGVRLGEPSRVADHYLHVIDLDVRDLAFGNQARAALATFIPEFDTLPFVISGSGGKSRHLYFLSERPFRSRKLWHTVEKFLDSEGKPHWAAELELFGTGKQVVLPPSIHPDTGKPYVWGRTLDLEDLNLGFGPVVTSTRVAEWAPELKPATASLDYDDDDLATYVALQPLDLTQKQIDETLALLPLPDWCEDRDGWLRVGMALHHQFEGDIKGLNLWNTFSRQSTKFDAKNQGVVWKSFSAKPGGIRFSTLLQAAEAERERLALDDYEEPAASQLMPIKFDADIEALLGPATPPANDVGQALPWTSLLDRNTDSQVVKSTLHNVELILKNDPRLKGIIRRNEFTLNECFRGVPGFKAFGTGRRRPKPTKQLTGPIWELQDPIGGDLWSSTHNNSVRSMVEAPDSQGGWGIKLSDRDLQAAVNLVASDHPFHPVREYLESLVWDGKPRLDSLFVRYLGVADTSYHRAVARLPLIAAVTRAYEPGHKWDYVPIIEGGQGIRKSTFVAVLGKHWSCELNGDFSDRKSLVEKMAGAWIMEIPELAGFGKHEIEDIKAAISAPSDKVRLPWKPAALDYRRQSVFFGTTNSSEYLRDPTGGRRFWPVRCVVDQIDINGLAAEVDQVWAEALTAYRGMRTAQPFGMLPLYLSGAEAAADARIAQEDRRGETSEELWANRIELWLDTPEIDDDGFAEGEGRVRNEVTLREAWTRCFGRDESQLTAQVSSQLSRAMKLVPTFFCAGPRRAPGGGRVRVYRRKGWDPA